MWLCFGLLSFALFRSISAHLVLCCVMLLLYSPYSVLCWYMCFAYVSFRFNVVYVVVVVICVVTCCPMLLYVLHLAGLKLCWSSLFCFAFYCAIPFHQCYVDVVCVYVVSCCLMLQIFSSLFYVVLGWFRLFYFVLGCYMLSYVVLWCLSVLYSWIDCLR